MENTQGWTDVLQSLKGLMAAHLKIKHAFYTLTSNLDSFRPLWGFRQGICTLREDCSLVLIFFNLLWCVCASVRVRVCV